MTLVSYMGAQPQMIPEEYKDKTEQQLSDLGFTVCPTKPSTDSGETLWWENNQWVIKPPTEGEKSVKRTKVNKEIVEKLAQSDRKIIELSEKHISIPQSILEYRDTLRSLLEPENPFAIQLPEEPVIELSKNDEVKAEAARRILEICPEWKQRNLTAQAAILAKKGEANWSPEEVEAWTAGEQIWAQIATIRAKSDELESMAEIPADFKNDSYWV